MAVARIIMNVSGAGQCRPLVRRTHFSHPVTRRTMEPSAVHRVTNLQPVATQHEQEVRARDVHCNTMWPPLMHQSRKYEWQRAVVQITLKHPVTRRTCIMNPSVHLAWIA